MLRFSKGREPYPSPLHTHLMEGLCVCVCLCVGVCVCFPTEGQEIYKDSTFPAPSPPPTLCFLGDKIGAIVG